VTVGGRLGWKCRSVARRGEVGGFGDRTSQVKLAKGPAAVLILKGAAQGQALERRLQAAAAAKFVGAAG